jgi:hypothetical protein
MDRLTDYNYLPPPPPPPPRSRNDYAATATYSHSSSGHTSPASVISRVASSKDAANTAHIRASGTVEQTPISQCASVYFTRRDLLDAAPDDPARAAEARTHWCRFIGQVCRACGLYPFFFASIDSLEILNFI